MGFMIGLTLGRYLSKRFLTMILAVFITIFGMIYIVDFVELLRRTGDMPGVSAGYIAYLSFLRAPAVAEQVLPFCVLFGAMAALLNLTRRLELLTARAAGISVWQFLVPPIAIAVLIGLLSITIYNPVSAFMKHRADGIEFKLFGHPGSSDPNQGVWIRQKSIDGQAIIHAESGAEGGTKLTGVSVYVYNQTGLFEETIEAARAQLVSGAWQLENVTILTPGEAPETAGIYLLASDLDSTDVSENLVSPNSVPFWELPGLRDRTESAGLDSAGYRLQFQMLLARPLLFVAMILIAAAFSLRFFRFGGIAKMVSGGVAAGFVLYIATKVVGDLGGSGLLSAPIAAWSPAIVASMLGTLALLNQEDG